MMTGDIAALVGVSRQYVQRLVVQRGFPKPIGETDSGVRVWRAVDVERWHAARNP